MADIAIVFHWTPVDMDGLGLGELMHWRGLAIERHNRLNGAA